jgi:integrase/recombinase XerD
MPNGVALAGFLAGYRGLTREAYALDLRQFTTWCRSCSLALFAVRRADIETFARDLEAKGRARATVTRRLSTIAGFYRYAVQEELLDRSPAAHVRRPRLDYESHAAALDRNELGALLVAAGLGPPPVHRTLTITRKGGKVVTVPLAPRTALGSRRRRRSRGRPGRHRPAAGLLPAHRRDRRSAPRLASL